MNKSIIYKATNKINNKIYIGQTTQGLIQRQYEHFNDSKYKRDNSYFHKAIRKYAKEGFEWEILIECPEQDLNTQEIYWIKYWNSFGKDGYNLTEGGGSFNSGKKHPNYDDTIYEFENKDGRKESCTKHELITKYNLMQTSVYAICSGRIKSTNGWGLKDWTKKVGNKYIIYNFKHKNGEVFIGTGYDFRIKYDLSKTHLSEVCNGRAKTIKGWSIDKKVSIDELS